MNPEHFARPDIQDRLRTIILGSMFNNPFKRFDSLNRLE